MAVAQSGRVCARRVRNKIAQAALAFGFAQRHNRAATGMKKTPKATS